MAKMSKEDPNIAAGTRGVPIAATRSGSFAAPGGDTLDDDLVENVFDGREIGFSFL